MTSAGGQFLEKLCGVLGAAGAGQAAPGGASGAGTLVERDAKTDRSFLRLPLPEPETLDRLAQLLGAFARK